MPANDMQITSCRIMRTIPQKKKTLKTRATNSHTANRSWVTWRKSIQQDIPFTHNGQRAAVGAIHTTDQKNSQQSQSIVKGPKRAMDKKLQNNPCSPNKMRDYRNLFIPQNSDKCLHSRQNSRYFATYHTKM